MLTDVVRADKDEEISRGEDEDKAGEAREDFCVPAWSPESLSL